MEQTLVAMARGALCVGALALFLVSAPARAQIEVDVYPPAAFVATAQPVYFEGRPAYWYGNRWYYREHRSWRAYREEPGYLREYRGRHEPVRHFYERGHWGYRHR